MKLLAFDCSLRCFSALLATGREEPPERVSRGPGEWRGEEIVALLDALCRRHGLDWSDLDALAVTVGPGSFTGIRTAVAVARALSLAADLPVHPVGTLEALALAGRERALDRPLAAVIPGKRGTVYAQCFAGDGTVRTEPGSLPAAELAARLPAQAVVVAPEAEAVAALLGPHHAVHTALPEAEAVAALARRRMAAGLPAVAGHLLEPLYLRAADANPAAGRPLLAPAE